MADLRRMRVIFIAAVIVLATGIAIPNGSQPPVEKKVTLQLADMPIIDVIDYMFQGTGYKYTIEPGVSGRISVGFNNIPLEQAVKAVADASSLDYTKAPGRYIFKPKAKTPVATKPMPEDQYQPERQTAAPPAASGGFSGTIINEQTLINEQIPPIPSILDIGGIGVLDYPYSYGGIYDLSPYSYYNGAPSRFVPPGYVSPSRQRFYDSISAAHSVPGFPAYRFGRPYYYPY
ncbi:MAG: STN domain-containing protein [Armatimonadota bacterium]